MRSHQLGGSGSPLQALASSPCRKRSWIPVPPQIYCRGTMARSGWMIEQSCEPRPSLGARPPPVASQPMAWIARGSPFLSPGCFAHGKNTSGLVGGAVDEAGEPVVMWGFSPCQIYPRGGDFLRTGPGLWWAGKGRSLCAQARWPQPCSAEPQEIRLPMERGHPKYFQLPALQQMMYLKCFTTASGLLPQQGAAFLTNSLCSRLLRDVLGASPRTDWSQTGGAVGHPAGVSGMGLSSWRAVGAPHCSVPSIHPSATRLLTLLSCA